MVLRGARDPASLPCGFAVPNQWLPPHSPDWLPVLLPSKKGPSLPYMIPLTRYEYHAFSLAFGQSKGTWAYLATQRAGKCKLDYTKLSAQLKMGVSSY